jgi:Ca-activated chloride channel family protein
MSPIGQKSNGDFHYGKTPVQIDEDLLKQIAAETGGKYFRASSNTRLEEIYDEINTLERTEIEEFKFTTYSEMFRNLTLIAFGILLLEVLLRYTLFRSFV